MKASLEGQLKSFRLFDLLMFLNLCRKTGTLALALDSVRATAFFKDGDVIFATTNQMRLRLGSVLRTKKYISAEDDAKIMAVMNTRREKFGQIALRLGVLDEDQLKNALKMQVSEIIYDCLPWTEGEFTFTDGMELPDYAVTIAVDVQNLIMEGARRIDEWEQCVQLLPDESIVFKIHGNPQLQERVSLSMDEWKILFAIDGERSLKQIVEESGEEPLDVYRVIYGLAASNIVEEVIPDASTRKTIPQKLPEPIPSPAGHTGKIAGQVLEISEEQWMELVDDTRLLVSEDATLSLRDIRRMAQEIARVKATLPDGETRVIPLVDAEYVIGRSAECSIHFTDSGVSGRHARLTRTGDGYLIEDMNSRNGTYVNGKSVEKQMLRDGDDIQVGRVLLEYAVVYDVRGERTGTR